MKILFTGASSFTGFWFVRELALAGHQLTTIFRSSLNYYSGLRLQRIQSLASLSQPVFNCEFGSERFLNLIKEKEWDLFCHHAADVNNYKSPQFDIAAALANNTRHVHLVLDLLQKKGCQRAIISGSIFELGEGAGSDELRAFSPYGLSKSFTAEVFKYHAQEMGIKLGKFVIPNPFGPYEEPRFTSYLIQNWFEGKVPRVNTPAYIRDNIFVSLLARAYVYFVEQRTFSNFEKFNPSGYVESQGAFTRRFAQEMSKRLNISCQFELVSQHHFPEPQVRINTDVLNPTSLNWEEEAAWDELARYYQSIYQFHTN